MEVYEAIYARRTVRDFAAREIEPALLRKILAAGFQAPSNDHLRKWEFLVITDPDTRLRLIEKTVRDLSQTETAAILDGWGLVDSQQRAMYLGAIPKPKQYRIYKLN